LYVLEHVTHLTLTWDTVVIGVSLGVGTALLSAAWPTLTALRMSPLAAMQQRGVYSQRQAPLWPLTLVGLALLLGAYGLSRLPAIAGVAGFGYLASLALGVGTSCLVSPGFRALGRLCGRTLGRWLGGCGAVSTGQFNLRAATWHCGHGGAPHQLCHDDQRVDHDCQL